LPQGIKSLALIGGGGVLLSIVALPVIFLLLLSGGPDCGQQSIASPTPSAQAQRGIPANYLALYQQSGRDYGVPWSILAAIGSIETDHGRSTAQGVRSGVNANGCCAGPMQFSVVGAGGGTWGAYGVDGDHNGHKNVYDPVDAIPGAASYLKASGAPQDLHSAIFAYNRAEWYVQKVLALSRTYGAASDASLSAPATATVGSCDDGGGIVAGSGDWTLAPGANRPGVPLTPAYTAFVNRMAAAYPGRLVLTTGTNHSQLVAGTNRESDHWNGNAGDFGMVLNGGTNDGPVGDQIAAAAFMAAGLPHDAALRAGQTGGLVTVVRNGVRIQVIWKADGHHDHVHAGIGLP
jgi:hypothetical protein